MNIFLTLFTMVITDLIGRKTCRVHTTVSVTLAYHCLPLRGGQGNYPFIILLRFEMSSWYQ